MRVVNGNSYILGSEIRVVLHMSRLELTWYRLYLVKMMSARIEMN